MSGPTDPMPTINSIVYPELVHPEPSAYADAVATVAAANAHIKADTERHNSEVAKWATVRSQAQAIIDHAERGGDPEAFAVAQRILEIRWGRELGPRQRYGDSPRTGPVRVTSEVLQQLNAAIETLRNGGDAFVHGYYGVKSYDRWDSQASSHPYGYGPGHGSVWFSVGFQSPYRDSENPPTEQERLACIRYLAAIRDNPALMGGES